MTTELSTHEEHRRNGLKQAAGRLRRKAPSTTQTGASMFPHLVWAHYRWERQLHDKDGAQHKHEEAYQRRLAELEDAYERKLTAFQGEQGKLEQVYWCTTTASAVGMTVKRGPKPRFDVLRLRERDDTVRFHRVTDWVTRDAPQIADLLNDCDLLASRVEHVLRGASQRIATRWILGIATHLLGFLERDQTDVERRANEPQFVHDQREKLAQAEAYYQRAASQAGRIIYVSGMLMGLGLVAVACALAAWLLSGTSMSDYHRKLILLCCGTGAVGALVSTISRMGNPAAGKFNVDFELGRRTLRRLGVFRPFVGAIFGGALAFLLLSGLLSLRPARGLEPYYYGFAAFLAGFSERFATVMLGGAEERLVPTDKDTPQPPPEATAPEEI